MSPSVPSEYRLGLVEGFFGRAWSWQARKDCAGFLRQLSFDTYIYAPKEDVWLRKQWEQPFPRAHRVQLQQLCRHFHDQGLSFGVGLSPFEAYRDFNRSRRQALQAKIDELNSIGADTLCLLFDDMPGDMVELAREQVGIMDFVREHSRARSFILCPTYYSFDPALAQHFGAMPPQYLEALGERLDPAIQIFWTGPKVVSHAYPAEHLQTVSTLLRRKPVIWDNYPVNDGQRLTPFLHLRPFERDVAVLGAHAAGHMINPMNQAWLSRLALHSLARLYEDDSLTQAELFELACENLCPGQLGRCIAEDIALFQDEGLDNMSAADRDRLLRRYQRFAGSPFAQEIVDWLNGHYTFDPACLT